MEPAPAIGLEQRLQQLQEAFHHTDDLVLSVLQSSTLDSRTVLVYLEPLVDSDKIRDSIVLPLSQALGMPILHALGGTNVAPVTTLKQAIDLVLLGYCLVCSETEPLGAAVQVDTTYTRSIMEPQNEKVVRGSHEGMVEQMSINLNLIRRKITSEKLTIKYYFLGTETKTKTAVIFMDEIVNPRLVRKVERRLKSIHSDDAFSADYAEDLIEENPWSLFPQILHTERPDRVAANLMEGRVAVLMEGSPTSLIMPVTFAALYQSPDDYNSRWMVGSFFRMIRVFSFFLAFSLPAIYIAVISYHFEIVPNELILPMQSAVRDIPFPPIVEAMLMEITIELLREMGIRLPTPISQTIGIVGGLVIGDAVVKAGFVSSVMIIVVAVTAIASFVVPSNEMSLAVRLLRFPFMILASLFGILGISFGFTLVCIHLCKLESFGTPFLAGTAPFKWSDIKDTFVRLPQWLMNTRPSFLRTRRKRSQASTRKWAGHESKQRKTK
ncbi:spore germination protein [Paenibacillus sp. HJGM_3]|uniref:spore germination protein n=1 Tax=Paenibacillus sp. HJGM_3 TaxID=3379816 RepID=UPI00385F0110